MSFNKQSTGANAAMDRMIFWPAVIVVTVVTITMILFEERAKVIIDATFNWLTRDFGFLYQWFGLAALGLCLWCVFQRMMGAHSS